VPLVVSLFSNPESKESQGEKEKSKHLSFIEKLTAIPCPEDGAWDHSQYPCGGSRERPERVERNEGRDHSPSPFALAELPELSESEILYPSQFQKCLTYIVSEERSSKHKRPPFVG